MGKKITILGKISFFYLFFTSFLFGSVTAFVDKTTFNQGEEVLLFIEAKGKNIEFPQIKKLGEIPIEGSHKSEKIIQEDGKTVPIVKMQYNLIPNSSFIIPPIEITIDGISQKTNPIEVTKNQPIATTNDDLQLILETKKEKVYVGESFVVSLSLKYKKELQNIEYALSPIVVDNFLIKEEPNTKVFEEDGYKIFQKEYLFFPQKGGKYEIPSQSTRVTLRGKNFTMRKNIYSMGKTLEISPLPNGINLLGEYKIRLETNKRETEPNKPINLTLIIEGIGNIDELKEFSLDILNTFTHSTKPLLETTMKNGLYGGKFIQKFSLISESDFEIPPFVLEFYNPKSDTIEKIKTKPIEIFIKEEQKEIATIEVSKNPEIILFQGTTLIEKIGYVLFGTLFGILSFYTLLKLREFKFKKTKSSLNEKIFKTKKDKELYHLLLPYASIEELKPCITLLEENLYFKGKNKIDKEELCEILEKF